MDEVLTIPKAAQHIAPDLGLSPNTVGAYLRTAIAKGELQTYKKGNRKLQFLKRADVDEYKKRQMAFIPLQISG